MHDGMEKSISWFFLFLGVISVSIAFSGSFDPGKENLSPSRYQGVRINGVQGGIFVVDTASAKVRICGITPAACTPWNN